RCIPLVHRIPVDARHVLDPELIALQTPYLTQHLAPFRTRLHRETDTIQVDPAAGTRVFVVHRMRLAVAIAFLGDVECTQAPAFTHDQRDAVDDNLERIGLLGDDLRTQRAEVERLEPSRRFLVAATTVYTRYGKRGPDCASARADD